MDKTSKILGTIFGFFELMVSIFVFYAGINRISSGISSISDYETSHFANVGLLYIKESLIALIFFVFVITYSLTKKKNND